MSVDPIEFSRRGDEVFARLADRFAAIRAAIAERLIVFDEPVSRASERAPDADDRPFGLPYRTIALE